MRPTPHPRTWLTLAPCALTLLQPLQVLAHDGHGHIGSHWHATDVWGFVVVLGLAAVAAFWPGRK